MTTKAAFELWQAGRLEDADTLTERGGAGTKPISSRLLERLART